MLSAFAHQETSSLRTAQHLLPAPEWGKTIMRLRPWGLLAFATVTTNATDEMRTTKAFGLRYVLRVSALALIPVLAFVSLTHFIADVVLGMPLPAPRIPSVLQMTFGWIVFSPQVETAIMIPVIYLLTRVLQRPIYVAAVSGALWGVAHAYSNGPLALVTAWPFFVYTLCFLAWRSSSLKRAYWYTAVCHANYNAILCGIILGAVAGAGATG